MHDKHQNLEKITKKIDVSIAAELFHYSFSDVVLAQCRLKQGLHLPAMRCTPERR